MSVSIEEAHEVHLELMSAFARLIPQLSKSAPSPDADEMAEMLADPGTTVFVARSDDEGIIIGTLTLVIFRIPTGRRAWIEDVVVDGDAVRGKGWRTGEALTLAALDKAREAGVTTVDLTSRPARQEANALYQRLGFESRDTNVWRFTLE